MVVYQATCKQSKKIYIGNTQQKLKKRIDQHLDDVCHLANKGVASDSFAKHFAAKCDLEKNTKRKNVQELLTVDILWSGNPISCMKNFGTPSCALCMKERLLILKALRKEPDRLINSRDKLYGACRHRSKFHWYTSDATSTDEGQ